MVMITMTDYSNAVMEEWQVNFHAAMDASDTSEVEFLVRNCPQPKKRYEDFWDWLAYSAQNMDNFVPVLRILLSNDLPVSDDALTRIAHIRPVEEIQFLLDSGFKADSNRSGALFVAASWNRVELMQLLIERGAKIQQSKAFMSACEAGAFKALSYLNDQGEKPNKEALVCALTQPDSELLVYFIRIDDTGLLPKKLVRMVERGDSCTPANFSFLKHLVLQSQLTLKPASANASKSVVTPVSQNTRPRSSRL